MVGTFTTSLGLCLLSTAICAPIIAWGAISMRRLKHYPLAVAAAVLAILPLHFTFVLGMPIGIWALVVLSRPEVRLAFGRRQPAASFAPVLILVGIVAVIPLALALMIGASYFAVQSAPYKLAPPTKTVMSIEVKPSEGPKLIWSDGVPRLGSYTYNLTASQVESVDDALTKIHAEYVALEAKHTERKWDDLGHLVVSIRPFPKELNRLEDQFWTQVDSVVTDNNQRGRLREELPLRGEVFALGEAQRSIQIWKVGEWYNWRWDFSESRRGPNLPASIQHLWQEEVNEIGAEKKETSKE